MVGAKVKTNAFYMSRAKVFAYNAVFGVLSEMPFKFTGHGDLHGVNPISYNNVSFKISIAAPNNKYAHDFVTVIARI